MLIYSRGPLFRTRLSLKLGFGECGHGFDRCDRLDELGGFGGFNGFSGFGGFDGLGGFDG